MILNLLLFAQALQMLNMAIVWYAKECIFVQFYKDWLGKCKIIKLKLGPP